MRKVLTVLGLILCLSVTVRADDGSEPKISLLTCSAGNELYSQFGHSALRLYYPSADIDIVFNFGTFDFSTPNFYYKFVKGKLEYLLDISTTSQFIYEYEYFEREVYEQELNLTPDQKQKIIARLDYLYKPENRSYLYSFLYKNCTTVLRDIILEVVEIDGDILEEAFPETDRDLLDEYTSGWVRFGINLILGSSLDRQIDFCQSMFLPENLMSGLSLLTVSGEPLVSDEKLISKAVSQSPARSFISILISPTMVFAVIFLIGIIFLLKYNKIWRVYRRVIFWFCGLAGVVLLSCILITEHVELYKNYNLLLFNPLWILLAITPDKSVKFKRILCSLMAFFILIMVVIWLFGVQKAEPGFVILALNMLMTLKSLPRRSFPEVH